MRLSQRSRRERKKSLMWPKMKRQAKLRQGIWNFGLDGRVTAGVIDVNEGVPGCMGLIGQEVWWRGEESIYSGRGRASNERHILEGPWKTRGGQISNLRYVVTAMR